MADQLTLMDLGPEPPRPPSSKDRVLVAHEARHRAYLERLRAALRVEFARLQRPLSADDAHRLMAERPAELRMPSDLSPLALGALFKGDQDDEGRPRWDLMGLVVSTREKGKLIRSWACIR